MTPQQKISVLGLGVFAIAANTLGLLHINQGIIRPIAIASDDNTLEVGNELAADETYTELSSKDTDNDGLNDYEELHVFGTSPYLTDTDGDNLEDAAEIQSGGDPNCPVGKDCSGGLKETQSYDAGSAVAPAVSAPDQQDNPEIDAIVSELEANGVTPAFIREALTQFGFTSEQLQSIDDDQLMQLFIKAQLGESAQGGS